MGDNDSFGFFVLFFYAVFIYYNIPKLKPEEAIVMKVVAFVLAYIIGIIVLFLMVIIYMKLPPARYYDSYGVIRTAGPAYTFFSGFLSFAVFLSPIFISRYFYISFAKKFGYEIVADKAYKKAVISLIAFVIILFCFLFISVHNNN